MDRIDALLRLVMCRGIGPLRGKEILERCGDPAALFALEARALEARTGLPPPLAAPVGDPRYPPLLAHAPAHPLILWVWGEPPPHDAPPVAVIGTRRASAYGRRQAVRLVRELAAYDLPIVSGLARGIDRIAHEEALRAGTFTIAVLGSGIGRLYPPEHAALAGRIARAGAVLSELPLFTAPRAYHFPRRNRIIAGLSIGVLVVEGGTRSGTMITARHAAEQGRLVFAVPGPIDSSGSSGVNALLRDGAVLTTSAEDVLAEFGELYRLLKSRRRVCALPPLTPLESAVLDALPSGPVAPDAAAAALGRPIGDVLGAITALEIKGRLHRSGNTLERLE